MKNVSPNRQMMLNLSSALVVFVVNILINFFLSPIIVNILGVEANGFVQLANNFVSYITIITIALNSMSARFITISFHQKDFKKASEYYSSTFAGNIVMLILLIIPVSLGILFIDNFILISEHLVDQVRLLFVFVFLNFFISMIFSIRGVAFFATNRIYLQSIGNIIFSATKAIITILLFAFFPAQIWYTGMAMTISNVALQYWQHLVKKKLMPEISFKNKYVKFNAIKMLISSGIWNSINQLGVVLFYGLDLVMINIFIGAEMMGIVAIAKIIPTMFGSLQGAIMNTFTPNLTILYAKGMIAELVDEFFKAGKLSLVITGIPFSAFIVFGEVFFSLWMPNQDGELLQNLAIISMISPIFMLGIQPLWQIFVVVNKTKENALSVIMGGIVNVFLTLVVLQTTDLGIFAVLGISSIISILKNIMFTIPFSAKYLGLKWHSFFPLVGLTFITFAVNYSIGFMLSHVFSITTWLGLAGMVCAFSILGLCLNTFIILRKGEREILIEKIFRRKHT